MRKGIVLLMLSAFVCAGASAQNTGMLSGDPFSLSLSGTTVASADANPMAFWSNPAAAALFEGTAGASASYTMWQPSGLGQTLISGGGYYRMGALAFSLGVQQAKDMNSYTLYSEAGVPNGTFTPSGLCGGLSVAYQVMDNLSVAGGVRYFQESLAAGEKDSSVGVELSALYRTGSLTAGIALQNLLGSMMARVGAGYSLASLDLSAEIDYLSGGGLMAGLGVQYGYKDMVFVRGGLHYGDSAKAIPSYVSLGLGAKLFGVRLDAAYILTDSALGNTLSAGLGYAF